jgi:hypothetical protein
MSLAFPDSSLVPEAEMKIATCQEERGFLGDAARTLKAAKEGYPNRRVIEDRLESMGKRGTGHPSPEIMQYKVGLVEAFLI